MECPEVSGSSDVVSRNKQVTTPADVSIDRVLGELSVNYPQADLKIIQQAFELARTAHEGQKRASGEPYIIHPLAVAQVLAGFRMDCVTIAAALLHDVVEDAKIEDRQLRHEFGEEIAFLVEGVTKVTRLVSDSSYEEDQLESFRRLLVATAQDQRTVLIKLADRLHNMRTLQHLSSEQRKTACQSTLDIYAPLAHRMGMGRIKDELEDLALKFLHPDVYRDLKEKIALKTPERQLIIEQASEMLRTALEEEGLQVEIAKRVKHYYSIYRKMVTTQRSFDEIYDLLALRILTEKESECYLILGKVHQLWKPLDGRFKDFISVPKVNGYRSLHTTVVGPRSRLVEIQIRTYDMHNVAENGIAAHWRYKRDRGINTKVGDDTRWLGQFSQDLLETVSPEEFMDSLKVDLFAEEIMVFTPNSDLIQLPRGSTIVDFAYKIHSEVGDRCRAGKVNGKFVPLSYVIQTGDRVEVITKKDAHPSRDWLGFAKTARARNKIRKFLMQIERGELLETGRALLTRELERFRVSVKLLEDPEKMARVFEDFHLRSLDELYVSVGFGKVLTKHVISRLLPKTQLAQRKQAAEHATGIIPIRDIDGYTYRRALCCNPLPGDPIIGFVTKNRGISIHAKECPSLAAANVSEARLLPLFWDRGETESYQVEIGVEATDRERLLSDITSVIASTGTNIRGSVARSQYDGTAKLIFVMDVVDVDHVNRVINRLISIPGVKTVIRKTKPSRQLADASNNTSKTKRKRARKKT